MGITKAWGVHMKLRNGRQQEIVKKYSLRVSIICAYHPPPKCRVIHFKRYEIRRTCSTHGDWDFGRKFQVCNAEGWGPLWILIYSWIDSINVVLFCVKLSRNVNVIVLWGITPCSLVGGYQFTWRIIPEEFTLLSTIFTTIWSILNLTTLQHFLAVSMYRNLVSYSDLNSWFVNFLMFSNVLCSVTTRVGTLIVATIYLQLIQNRYMFRSFSVLQCSHQHCLQPVARDVEVVGYHISGNGL